MRTNTVYKTKFVFLVLTCIQLAAFSACRGLNNSGPSDPSVQACSFSVRAVYEVGTDPSKDFKSGHVKVTETISESSCSDALINDENVFEAKSVSRKASKINIEQKGKFIKAAQLALKVENGLLTIPNFVICQKGVRTAQILKEGSIDVENKSISVVLEYSTSSCGKGGPAPTPSPSPEPEPENTSL